jgi:cob(I)alamin adenosyltransferase
LGGIILRMKARIYTKTGDKGETSLVGGSRVSKGHPRLDAYGTIDELNSVIGLIRAHCSELSDQKLRSRLESRLQQLQNSLFNVGSALACENDEMRTQLPALHPEVIQDLEGDMDRWESKLPPLKEFILPGGSTLAAFSHQARTVCRRAERDMIRLRESGAQMETAHVIFVNRLSDWLFLLARRSNASLGIDDVKWSK